MPAIACMRAWGSVPISAQAGTWLPAMRLHAREEGVASHAHAWKPALWPVLSRREHAASHAHAKGACVTAHGPAGLDTKNCEVDVSA